MKPSKVLSAFLALLLMANMSFAQNAKMKKNVNAKARYERILTKIRGHKSIEKDAPAFYIGLPSIVGASYLTFGSTSAVAAGGATISTGGAALILIAAGTLLYGAKTMDKKSAYSGEDRADLYPGIAKALTDGKVFAKYKVVLTNTDSHPSAPHMTQHALNQLTKFLAHPYNMVLVEEFGPNQEGDYRFYFDFPAGHPDFANRNIYADVDMETKTIIVRSDVIRNAKNESEKQVIKPKKKK